MRARTGSGPTLPVCVEVGRNRAFASALDWPGWCRSGRDELAALDALADHAHRYRAVADEAHLPFAVGEFTVIERIPGTATTDFGAPDRAASAEAQPLTAADIRRLNSLVASAWTVFDRVIEATPASLRKGPRGGGRDRDAMVDHVLAAEHAYARKLGVRVPQPHTDESAEIASLRQAILGALAAATAGEPLVERGWLPRYAARRIAWHVLDHAWEMEDRREP
ncbi:MAG: hypothetical protein ABI352_10845 [Candidatus Dormibacter sp.]